MHECVSGCHQNRWLCNFYWVQIKLAFSSLGDEIYFSIKPPSKYFDFFSSLTSYKFKNWIILFPCLRIRSCLFYLKYYRIYQNTTYILYSHCGLKQLLDDPGITPTSIVTSHLMESSLRPVLLYTVLLSAMLWPHHSFHSSLAFYEENGILCMLHCSWTYSHVCTFGNW